MTQLIKQPTLQPTRKQNFNLLGSQLTAVGLGIVAMFWPDIYARIPPDFGPAFGGLLAGLIGYAFGYIAKERLV